MIWKKFVPMHCSTVQLYSANSNNVMKSSLEIGRVHTGKQRVFVGYYGKIEFGDFICVEFPNLRGALFEIAKEIGKIGYSLNIYGYISSFYESGLSADTGWGYVNDIARPVLMIDEVGTLRDPITNEMVKHGLICIMKSLL